MSVAALAAIGTASAQSIGNSPYAAFGTGDVKYDNTLDITAMGGVSSAFSDDFGGVFNFTNPAANKNLTLTSFKIEGTGEMNFFESDRLKVRKNSSYLSNISLAFPIGEKVKFGIGYQPYSSRRYDIRRVSDLKDNASQIQNFRGSGTLNTVQAAVSYALNEEFSVGAKTNFYFGNLLNTEELTYSTADFVNGYETKNTYKMFNFTVGAMYQKMMADDHKWTIGANYSFGNAGTAESVYTNSTYLLAGEEKISESVVSTNTLQLKNSIPSTLGVGIGYGMDRRWFLGGQFTYKSGADMQYFGKQYSLNPSYRIAAGGWVLPNVNNFRNYFGRVIYRAGAFYEKGGLNISSAGVLNSGKDINSYGLSLGASLPFQSNSQNRLSSLDLAVELGQRGTSADGLIGQKFVNFKIGLNFTDRWFQKRVYD